MLPTERVSYSKLVKELFPPCTPSQLLLIMEKVKDVPFGTASTAIRSHALAHEFLSIPQFMEAMRAETVRLRKSHFEGRRIIDFAIAESKRSGGPDLSNWALEDALLYHFSNCWKALAASSAPQSSIQMIRGKLFADAARAFLEIGLDPDCSVRQAEICIDLQPGERVTKFDLAQIVKREDVNHALPYDAIKALADLPDTLPDNQTAPEVQIVPTEPAVPNESGASAQLFSAV